MSAVRDVDDARQWTAESLDEFLAQECESDLDWRRFEIVDGVLLVSPPATPLHETLVTRLAVLLSTVVPDRYAVTGSIRIGIGRSYRVTDLTVVAAEAAESDVAVRTQDVLVAVEVESPSSLTTDRITKPAQYAMAGIPFYWRVETDPVRLTAYRLADAMYAPIGSWSATETASLADPFNARLDLRTLVRRVPRNAPA